MFTKDNSGKVSVVLNYTQVIDGVEALNTCVFQCRRRKNHEAKEAARDFALQPQPAEINPSVDTLASVLLEAPQGFGDFPDDDRPLSERVVEYFNGTDLEIFALHAANEYRRLTWPVEFFRLV
ncbi:MAG: hypothetical protein WBV94_10545 [Blastocatellia bacterium]